MLHDRIDTKAVSPITESICRKKSKHRLSSRRRDMAGNSSSLMQILTQLKQQPSSVLAQIALKTNTPTTWCLFDVSSFKTDDSERSRYTFLKCHKTFQYPAFLDYVLLYGGNKLLLGKEKSSTKKQGEQRRTYIVSIYLTIPGIQSPLVTELSFTAHKLCLQPLYP